MEYTLLTALYKDLGPLRTRPAIVIAECGDVEHGTCMDIAVKMPLYRLSRKCTSVLLALTADRLYWPRLRTY